MCPGCVGRRDPPNTLCDVRLDNGHVPTRSLWAPGASAPFRCHACVALGVSKSRETVTEGFKSRRDPTSVCKDILVVCPRVVDIRRTTPAELRSALLRVKNHLAPAPAVAPYFA